MSIELLIYVKSFLNGHIQAEEFVDIFQKKWKQERDSNELLKDNETLSEVLSTIFCLADMHNSDINRRDTEFDDNELTNRINVLLKENNLIS